MSIDDTPEVELEWWQDPTSSNSERKRRTDRELNEARLRRALKDDAEKKAKRNRVSIFDSPTPEMIICPDCHGTDTIKTEEAS